MSQPSIWVVFDCNVYLQALVNAKSPAAACLELARQGHIVACLSPETFNEIREVLNRPFVFKLLPHATPEMIEVFLTDVLATSRWVRHLLARYAFARDPKDAPYINLAITVEADYLVSRDKDLLDLMTDYTLEAKEFRQRFRSLKVVDPVAFLQKMDKISWRK